MEKSGKISRIGRIALIAACVMALLTVSVYAANEATDGVVFGKIAALVDGVTGKLIPRDEGYRLITEDGKSYDITVVEAGESGALNGGGVTYEVDLGDVPPAQFEMQFTNDLPEQGADAQK